MTREIVLDTETTGIDPADGHRVVEIGCVELDGLMPTGNTFHAYINPQRDMPTGAYEVHGLSAEFLSGFPVFSEHVDAFIEFIDDAPLVIHNASFDMKFLNAELALLGRPLLPPARAIDTLAMARKTFPGAQNSLDALCRRFGIDNASRTLHGALLDSELLAEVYLELKGGRQPGLSLDMAPSSGGRASESNGRRTGVGSENSGAQGGEEAALTAAAGFPRRDFPLADGDVDRHSAFLKDIKDPLWSKYGVKASGSE